MKIIIAKMEKKIKSKVDINCGLKSDIFTVLSCAGVSFVSNILFLFIPLALCLVTFLDFISGSSGWVPNKTEPIHADWKTKRRRSWLHREVPLGWLRFIIYFAFNLFVYYWTFHTPRLRRHLRRSSWSHTFFPPKWSTKETPRAWFVVARAVDAACSRARNWRWHITLLTNQLAQFRCV